MAHDRIAKEESQKDCPECGGSLSRETLERVPGGIDYEKVYCSEEDCNYSKRY